MIKSKAVRVIEMNGKRWTEALWVPDRGDSDLQREEWRVEDETTDANVSNPSAVQGIKAWPFPESAS
jgi:hypothetical protein